MTIWQLQETKVLPGTPGTSQLIDLCPTSQNGSYLWVQLIPRDYRKGTTIQQQKSTPMHHICQSSSLIPLAIDSNTTPETNVMLSESHTMSPSSPYVSFHFLQTGYKSLVSALAAAKSIHSHCHCNIFNHKFLPLVIWVFLSSLCTGCSSCCVHNTQGKPLKRLLLDLFRDVKAISLVLSKWHDTLKTVSLFHQVSSLMYV